jgi:hypothetical protein
MQKTILTHFYNEEYLLPWWLEHHARIFDHGIMIDYHSTDRSVDIIRSICPTWEIRTTTNKEFDVYEVDAEIEAIESTITGWKTCLTITEFLVGNANLMDDVPASSIYPDVYTFIDVDRHNMPVYGKPLWNQKTHGFHRTNPVSERSSRSIHNFDYSYIKPGRHVNQVSTSELCIFYFGWCPMTEQMIKRKLQIQDRLTKRNIDAGYVSHHLYKWDPRAPQNRIEDTCMDHENLLYRLESSLIPASADLSDMISCLDKSAI